MNEEKIISILKSSDGYVSGEKISELLDVSRTAVWKAINNLRDRGYHIDSSTNKGYDLVFSDDISDMNTSRSPFGGEIIYIKECISTNDAVRNEGALDLVILTDHQTGGKGRSGRNWIDISGRSIAMSILLKPDVNPGQIMPISLLAGLAVCKAIEEISGSECKLKWPNDILMNGKKIAGVLIESSTSGEKIQLVVLGIGINVNNEEFPKELTGKASSLYLSLGRRFSRKEIISRVLDNLNIYYSGWLEEYASSLSRFTFLDEYKDKCITIGSQVRILNGTQSRRAKALDITSGGGLTVRYDNGDTGTVLSGEVSVRGLYGYADMDKL